MCLWLLSSCLCTQMKPNYNPNKKIESETTQWARKENIERIIVTSQVWQRKGITCPNGTIPIRRFRKSKKLPKNTYGRKNPTSNQVLQSNDTVNLMLANHSVGLCLLIYFGHTNNII